MGRLTRRSFLGRSALATAALSSPLPRALAATEKPADLVDVHGADATRMVEAALAALGGIGRFVRPGATVVLKPNVAFASPREWGTATDPNVVVAIARACLRAGAKKVRVVEYPVHDASKTLVTSGLGAALAGVPEVELRILGEDRDFARTAVRQGQALKNVDVARAAIEADVLISLPVAKSHGATGVSFGMKNSMGLIRDRKMFHFAVDIHQALVDLARVIRPQLTVLDATRALLTGGPRGPGETIAPGRIIAGSNLVSVDAYGLTVGRFNGRDNKPADIQHIALAGKAGLGEIDHNKLVVEKLLV
jgi:uncharacterized protein (DUF362 family)